MDVSFWFNPGINVALQNISPFLTWLITRATVGDTFPWYLMIVSLVYLGLHPKYGVRIAVLFGICESVFYSLKLIFHNPRPFWVSSEVKVYQAETNFGFLSGGSMNAVALYGYIAITVRRWWITILCILVALWVILARLFAGDHFLGDIAGGLLGGLILLVLYMSAMPGVEKFVGTLSRPARILGIVALSCLPLILIIPAYCSVANWQLPAVWVEVAQSHGVTINPVVINWRVTGYFLGSLLGYEYLTTYRGGWNPPKDLMKKIVVVIAGTLSVLLVNMIVPSLFTIAGFSDFLPPVSEIFGTTLVFFWLCACVPLIAKKLNCAGSV
ncbi:phosphatase PAP2 family protein [Methanoregula sp.]|uniref:phosphatase PAP2 family protein n=1 Tax=Methanoregula sp. TaxID=2052170 RepID=UPI003BB0B47B